MNRFIPEPQNRRTIDNPVISVKLDKDIKDKFYKICKETNTSPSRMGNQMIKFAMENM